MTQVKPVLTALNLIVRNVDATVAFYRELGLDIPDDSIWRTPSGAHHVDVKLANGFSLDFDSPTLAREYDAGWRPRQGPGTSCVIGFSVPDRASVDDCHARIVKAGHPSAQPPYDTFWGARYAIVVDPDGNHVGIMSPPDPAQRRAPPNI
jgi:uncharacterized glyoxalase superfamily protein PhnB